MKKHQRLHFPFQIFICIQISAENKKSYFRCNCDRKNPNWFRKKSEQLRRFESRATVKKVKKLKKMAACETNVEKISFSTKMKFSRGFLKIEINFRIGFQINWIRLILGLTAIRWQGGTLAVEIWTIFMELGKQHRLADRLGSGATWATCRVTIKTAVLSERLVSYRKKRKHLKQFLNPPHRWIKAWYFKWVTRSTRKWSILLKLKV